jgi:hypothetical protein
VEGLYREISRVERKDLREIKRFLGYEDYLEDDSDFD